LVLVKDKVTHCQPSESPSTLVSLWSSADHVCHMDTCQLLQGPTLCGSMRSGLV